jgi:osmotically-inducible protein OsmY
VKNNEELQKDVQEAIKWEPLLHAAEIGVTVKDGVVTLTGIVDGYAKKFEAENATKSVAGVKAVVEKIVVQPKGVHKKNDNEIAEQVLNAFQWHWDIPNDKIKVKVEQGWITLEGEVHWYYQKEAAKNAIKNLLDVRGVSDHVAVKNETHSEIEKQTIERALARNWSIDDSNIQVIVAENKVTLSGTVQSWYQKDEAGRIAWKAPGVSSVSNELVFGYD